MKEIYPILFGAGFTLAVSLALGSLLLRALRLELYKVEAGLFAWVAGSGVLSLLITLLCLTGQAWAEVFLWGGIALILTALWRSRSRKIVRRSLPAVRLDWFAPFCLI